MKLAYREEKTYFIASDMTCVPMKNRISFPYTVFWLRDVLQKWYFHICIPNFSKIPIRLDGSQNVFLVFFLTLIE